MGLKRNTGKCFWPASPQKEGSWTLRLIQSRCWKSHKKWVERTCLPNNFNVLKFFQRLLPLHNYLRYHNINQMVNYNKVLKVQDIGRLNSFGHSSIAVYQHGAKCIFGPWHLTKFPHSGCIQTSSFDFYPHFPLWVYHLHPPDFDFWLSPSPHYSLQVGAPDTHFWPFS